MQTGPSIQMPPVSSPNGPKARIISDFSGSYLGRTGHYIGPSESLDYPLAILLDGDRAPTRWAEHEVEWI